MTTRAEIQKILDRNFTRGNNAKALEELCTLFDVRKHSLPLDEMDKEIDLLFENETKENLQEWLNDKKNNKKQKLCQKEKIYWTMRNGKKINVDDMTKEHLKNTLKMIICNRNTKNNYIEEESEKYDIEQIREDKNDESLFF